MSFPARRWRAPVTGAVTGLVVAAAIVGQSALASGGGATTPGAAATATTGSANQTASTGPNGSKAPADGPGEAPFLAAVTRMVQAGTINDVQARALDADIHTGRIDTDELVANGTLTSAQAQAVMDRLGAVKRSMAPAAQPSSAVKPVDASPGDAAPAESEAPFLAAVTRMVQAGTINDAQARVLDADIHTGRIDPDQLVANGTLSSAQAQAVMDRLGAVKRSMAPAAQQSRVVRPADQKRPQG